MVNWSVQKRLMESFPGSFINRSGMFIASRRENESIPLEGCKDERDVQCKVLEQFSRSAAAAHPYRTDIANSKFRKRMRDGINNFLGTRFTPEDMRQIYEHIGDRRDRSLTLYFIDHGYDMAIFRRRETRGDNPHQVL